LPAHPIAGALDFVPRSAAPQTSPAPSSRQASRCPPGRGLPPSQPPP